MSEEHEHKLKFQEKKILKKESTILSIDQAKEIEEQKQRIEDSIYKR